MTRTEQVTAKALERLNHDKYFLAKVVGKRAKEIENGARPLVDANTKTEKHTDIALREIAEGKLTPTLEL